MFQFFTTVIILSSTIILFCDTSPIGTSGSECHEFLYLLLNEKNSIVCNSNTAYLELLVNGIPAHDKYKNASFGEGIFTFKNVNFTPADSGSLFQCAEVKENTISETEEYLIKKSFTVYLYDKASEVPNNSTRKKYLNKADCGVSDSNGELNSPSPDSLNPGSITLVTTSCIILLVALISVFKRRNKRKPQLSSFKLYIFINGKPKDEADSPDYKTEKYNDSIPEKEKMSYPIPKECEIIDQILQKDEIITISKEGEIFYQILQKDEIITIPKEGEIFDPLTQKEEINDLMGSRAEDPIFNGYDSSHEIPEKNLSGDTELGRGKFGVVKEAILNRNGEKIKVAYKTVQEQGNKEEKRRNRTKFEEAFDLLCRETKIIQYIHNNRSLSEHHTNIVKYIGSVTKNLKNFELLLITECCFDDMEKFLRNNKKRYLHIHNKVNPAYVIAGNPYSEVSEVPPKKNYDKILVEMKDLFLWAKDIAEGMMFLSKLQIVHCDLAARNVLLYQSQDRLIAKITDFGLSRHLKGNEDGQSDELYYRIVRNTYLPTLWLAPEVLKDKRLTLESDVWSFGVTLWEIFSLGDVPYLEEQSVSGALAVYKLLEDGKRLGKPEISSPEIYSIMESCWKFDLAERPKFNELQESLNALIDRECLR